MDEARSKAVTEAFVRLYREGLIYRLVASNNHIQIVSSNCGHDWIFHFLGVNNDNFSLSNLYHTSYSILAKVWSYIYTNPFFFFWEKKFEPFWELYQCIIVWAYFQGSLPCELGLHITNSNIWCWSMGDILFKRILGFIILLQIVTILVPVIFRLVSWISEERHFERSPVMTMKFSLVFWFLLPIRLREIWVRL